MGPWEIILILAVLLLLFGAKRLPEIGAALGKGIREFKGSVRDIEKEIHRPDDRRGDLPRSEAPRAEAPRAEPGPDAARTGDAATTRDAQPRDAQPRDARPAAPDREPRGDS